VVETPEAAADRRIGKSATAFRTTGEAAEELEIPPHVLRFWESKFPQIRPLKRGGGRRYYRPEDLDLLRRIRQYLYQEGYTIRGVQKLLREGMMRGKEPESAAADAGKPQSFFSFAPVDHAVPSAEPAPSREALCAALDEVRRELMRIRLLLADLIAR
jgi:DNA-binding transcriptional MerR regulator